MYTRGPSGSTNEKQGKGAGLSEEDSVPEVDLEGPPDGDLPAYPRGSPLSESEQAEHATTCATSHDSKRTPPMASSLDE